MGGGTYCKNVKKLQTVINSTARWITNSGRRTTTVELMRRCSWLTVDELITMNTLCTFWKTIWKQIPRQIFTRLTINQDYTISTQEPRLQTCKLSYIWRATTSWNELPQAIREIKSYPRFKSNLRKHIESLRPVRRPPEDD